MPIKTPSTKPVRPRNIKRTHSGCRSCRKRGKKCDETKPSCRACVRLNLDCSYAVDFAFRNSGRDSFQRQAVTKLSSHASHSPRHITLPTVSIPPWTLNAAGNMEARYLNHFMTHVRHLLPANSAQFTHKTLHSPHLRSAILCLSASNLSMLNTQVQSRVLPKDSRRSVFSPLVNKAHHIQARKYHDQALQHCRSSTPHSIHSDAPAVLAAYTLLAYYHHASTDHLKFRLAVWDTVRFVARNRDVITASKAGTDAFQMWYRLCVSHRLSKPPALLLEGEGASSFGPNRYPDSFEQLYLNCIVGMSPDSLIYDILIKTMEIRSRLVVFRCVAGCARSSEVSRDIGRTAHGLFNTLLGRHDAEDECAEAEQGFVRGSHLQGLLGVQRDRLQVWKSRLRDDQRPDAQTTFPTHRDAMNVLYCFLCEMMFHESAPSTLHDYSLRIGEIINTLDFTASSTSDIYTFSLSEILLQLVQIYKSDSLFQYILDTVWPALESKARGYEHSHYPTHLVKRIIAQLAQYWAKSRNVVFALPAVPEDVGKLRLLDIYHPVDLVVCGWDAAGRYFVEKGVLP
ncbi:hypothetical protein BDW62DRAFT_218737 [Aspergillus aurantiobrunneus]